MVAGIGVRRPRPWRLARAVGERMGKRVIVARDGPGFLANRCARPFGMEALKLLAENVADHATIDRIVRMGGGFRMGPFELADLVGIDVGFEVTKSFWEQSFHEPRWRPSMIQARMVQAGRFGRKAGRGYYDYSGDAVPPGRPRAARGGRRDRRRRGRGRGPPRRRPARRRGRGGLRGARHRADQRRRARHPDRRRHGPLAARGRAHDRRPRDARARAVRRRQPGRARHARRRGRLPRAAAARRVAARRADALVGDARARRRPGRGSSSARSASTSSGSATRRGSCSGGSSASS